MASILTPERRRQFECEGYFVLESYFATRILKITAAIDRHVIKHEKRPPAGTMESWVTVYLNARTKRGTAEGGPLPRINQMRSQSISVVAWAVFRLLRKT